MSTARKDMALKPNAPDPGASERPENRTISAARRRRCLSCGESFESEGAHNWICRRCKNSQAWRQG
ncbi:MAG TPA: hypothetical protein VLL72_07820 [Kiloniellales bacterium]|nr:hypothetical protein [Kiloniellales bacterium]